MSILAYAQPVLTWQQVNTGKHELPWSVERQDDGNVLLAAIRYSSYASKHNLLMLKLDANGNPIKQKEITFSDTSIQTTGGVFLQNDTEIVVFCTIDLDSPYVNPLKWGCILLDTAFNFKSIMLNDVPVLLNNAKLIYPWYADYIKMKKDAQNNIYGTVVIRKKLLPSYPLYQESEYQFARYNSWIWMNNVLQLQYQRTDTVWEFIPNNKDTFRIDMRTGGGDMLKANDSIYITMQPDGDGGMIYTQYSKINNKLKFRQSYGLSFPEAWQTMDALSNFHSFIQLANWANDQFLIISPADHHFRDPLQDTVDHYLGQAVINVHKIKNSELDTFHSTLFTFTEPVMRNETPYESGDMSYNPAQIKSIDFLDKNKIYYTRVTADLGYTATTFHNSRMLISQFDSSLKHKWTKLIGDISDTDMDVVPYNILATLDGGCMAFARKKVRYFYDPYFPSYKIPEYDIVVYKLNSSGTITNIKELNMAEEQKTILVYPNPASQSITISGLTEGVKFILFDTFGRLILEKEVSEIDSQIQLYNINPGLYFYTISNQNFKSKSGKIIVSR